MTVPANARNWSGRTPHTSRGLWRCAPVLLLGTLVLIGCNVLNTLMPERAVTAMLGTLPEPRGVVLIDKVTRGTYGSDDRCIGAYTEQLYGTELAFDDVLGFYEENLPADKWYKLEEYSPPPIWTSPTKHFALVVSSNVEATFISCESIGHGREQFSTLYYVALSYVNNPAYCRAF